ncbi:MAG: hypothetical protein MUF81_18125 [Verrucomicrobia bacterium]|nr:hypothetical protein [Verrucomicrobiota bacterium]
MKANFLGFAVAILVFAPLFSSEAMARGDRADRRAGQDGDQLRTDIRQRRLKKVEELDELKLPKQRNAAQPSGKSKPAGGQN